MPDQQEVDINQSEREPLLSIGQPRSITTKREVAGLIIIGASGIARCTAIVFVKIGGSVFPSSQIIFARSVVQVVLCLVGCSWLRVHPFAEREGRKWVLVRGFVGALSLISYYYSLLHIQFADATVIMNLQSVFAVILAAIFLKEPFGWFERLCLLVCMLGAVLVAKPSFLFNPNDNIENVPTDDDNECRTLAIFAALAGAACSATAFVLVRATGTRAHYLSHTASYAAISLLLSSAFIQDFRIPEDLAQYTILGLTGFCAFIGQAMVNLGLQMAPAGVGTLMCTVEVVYAFLYGIFLFHEYPDYLSITGAVIITMSIVGIGWKKWRSDQSL